MERQEILSLTIALAGNEGIPPQSLHRTLSSLGKLPGLRLPVNFCKFVSRSYGAFSDQVDLDIDNLVNAGLVSHMIRPGEGVHKLVLTEAGLEHSGGLRRADPGLTAAITQVMRSVLPVSTNVDQVKVHHLGMRQ